MWAVLALFAAFLLTESVQLDIEFRRQTFCVSPSEVALVIGLVEVGGVWTAAARVGAVAIVLARQSLPLPKAVFNLSITVVEVCTALLVLSWLPPLALAEPLTWLSLAPALVGGSVVGMLLTCMAISLAGGFPGWGFLLGRCPRWSSRR